MFIRLLIYIFVGVLIYRTAKKWFGGSGPDKVKSNGNMPLRADDVMIQDPLCGVYFARRDGVTLSDGGQEICFCSEACKEKYLSQKTQQG